MYALHADQASVYPEGVQFHEVDIRDNADARAYIVDDLGYTEAPVVVVDDHDHWSGFQPDHIDRIANNQ